MEMDIEKRTLRRITWRIVPFIMLLYLIAYIDRVNIGFAALTMKEDLGFTASVLGFGAGIFFLGYFLFVPVLRKPQEMLTLKFWKDARRGVGLIFGPKDGVFGSTIGQILDYLRPDFHPNDHDTTEYLEYYKKKLLTEGGAIAPYFVKEFTPPVRMS